MRRLFNLFIKEENIDLRINIDLKDLTIKFNTWLYQIDKDTKKRRFSSTDRVNKFIMNKWVSRRRAEDKKIDLMATIESVFTPSV